MSEIQPRAPGVMPMLRRILTAQNVGAAVGICTLFGVFATWYKSGVTRDADYAAAVRHAADFESSVDKRLNELKDWQAQSDRDREAIRNALQAKIDELTSRFNQRIELRNDQAAVVNQRLYSLELKVCAFANRKVVDCK